MKNLKLKSILLMLSVVILSFSGCGNNDSANKSANTPTKPSQPAAQQKFNDNLDHQAFEKKYMDMCINQELELRKKEHPTGGNVGVADAALSDLCACIAKEESKRLTKEEARKFVNENEYPMSLMIKAGQAEEICTKK